MGLQYESYLQIVCFWLGNSHQIAQQSCMLLSEDDFGRASVVAKLIVRGELMSVEGRMLGSGQA